MTSPRDGALHVGDFFGPLVDEQHDQVHLGVVLGDAVGDALQEHRLAGARRRDDEAALALAERRQQVHHASRQVLRIGLEVDLLLRVERREVLEEDLLLGLLRRLEVDRLDLDQREVALAVLRRPDDAGDRVARVQVELADLRRRHVDVVRARQVVVVGRAQEAEAVRQRLEHAFREDVAALLGAHAQDLEDQLLLAHAGGAGDVELLGDLGEGGDVHLLHCRERDRLRGSALLGRRLVRRRAARGGRRFGGGGRGGDRGWRGAFFFFLLGGWGGGGAYAAVCFGRLAIIFHSSSSPSPVRAETSGHRHFKHSFHFSSMTRRVRPASACPLWFPRRRGHMAGTASHSHAFRSDESPG